jgi:hypothetical protein
LRAQIPLAHAPQWHLPSLPNGVVEIVSLIVASVPVGFNLREDSGSTV